MSTRLRRLHRLAALTLLTLTLTAWLLSDFYTFDLTYAPSDHRDYTLSLERETLRFESDDFTHYSDLPTLITPGWYSDLHPDAVRPLVPEQQLHPAVLGFYCGAYDNIGSFGTHSRNTACAIPSWFLSFLAFLHYRLTSPPCSSPSSARPPPRWQISVLATLFLSILAFWILTDFYSIAILAFSRIVRPPGYLPPVVVHNRRPSRLRVFAVHTGVSLRVSVVKLGCGFAALSLCGSVPPPAARPSSLN